MCFCLLVLEVFTTGTFGEEVAWGSPGVSGGFGEWTDTGSVMLE